MIRVLLTGGGGAGNEALYRLLGKHYVLHFGDADLSAIDPEIPVDRRHKLPWASEPDFVTKMGELCRRLEIDLLIPGVDEELLALAQNADKLAPARLLLPDAAYVETMLDKMQMIQALSARNIPVPLTQTLADDSYRIGFPCISKPRSGRGSRDVKVLSTLAEAMALKSTLGPLAHQVLVQEKIEGVEYTVQMIANADGYLSSVVPVKIEVKRGITLRAETEAESKVIFACVAIHQAVPTKGTYNIQLMLTPKGEVLPFEINPRISTTLCLALAADIDPIAIYLGDSQRKEILPFIAGIQLRRHWKNCFYKRVRE
jgi:carbamoyl-phosphate synthase large subunit